MVNFLKAGHVSVGSQFNTYIINQPDLLLFLYFSVLPSLLLLFVIAIYTFAFQILLSITLL